MPLCSGRSGACFDPHIRRFGMLRIDFDAHDFDTQERTLGDSAHLYSQVIACAGFAPPVTAVTKLDRFVNAGGGSSILGMLVLAGPAS